MNYKQVMGVKYKDIKLQYYRMALHTICVFVCHSILFYVVLHEYQSFRIMREKTTF